MLLKSGIQLFKVSSSPCVVVSGVLLAGHELLWVEELPVGASPDLVHHRGLQVQEDGPGHVLPGTSLREEGREGVIGYNGLVGGKGAVRLQACINTDLVQESLCSWVKA